MREVEFPSEWVTGNVERFGAYETPEGQSVILALLSDGANIWAMVYEGGARFGRSFGESYATCEILEREEGAPLDGERTAVERNWRFVMDVHRQAWLLVDGKMRTN